MTNDGLLAVSDLLGVQTLPPVLGLGPRQDTVDAWRAAQRAALAELRESGLVDSYDDVRHDLADALFVLAHPDREIVARGYGVAGSRRICLARSGTRHAVAVRTGEDFEVRTVWSDGDGASLARPILDVLGQCPPADIVGFSAPAAELRTRLDAARGSADHAQILRTLGVDDRDAMAFGMAMAECRDRTEIVAYVHRDGATTRSSGAAAVYDTARGRIVASPGISSDPTIWTTFTPGSDHRIAQAISALVDTVPGGRWMPSH